MTRAHVAAIIQARMTSTRLPGKVLTPLAGAPALDRMLERVARARELDSVTVATSVDPSDDPIAARCEALGVRCSRGSLADVLGRMVAATPDGAEAVVRLTADCPLLDPALVDRCVATWRAEQPWAEYVTNANVRTYPDGLDVEVVTDFGGDTTAPDHLVRQFTARFWSRDWPGASRPAVFYDPRSIDLDRPGAVLHAKAVVADDESVLVTSANLTEAAFDRNIELGLLVRDRALASSVAAHFRVLIDRGLLRPLPGA